MPLNTDNLKSQLRKGLLEFCVLLILSKKEVYASELIALLKSAHLIVVEGTIYPLLTRLKKDGALAYRWEESPSGPPRKYYALTDQGAEALRTLRSEWAAISATVNRLLDLELPAAPPAEPCMVSVPSSQGKTSSHTMMMAEGIDQAIVVSPIPDEDDVPFSSPSSVSSHSSQSSNPSQSSPASPTSSEKPSSLLPPPFNPDNL